MKEKKHPDLCDLCGGELSEGVTSLEIWREENLVVLKDIPADVCQQCGEAYLSSDASEKIDCFFEKYSQCQPRRYITVPEFSLAQAVA